MDSYTYQPLTEGDEGTFQHYSKSIEKAVRQTFPSIPADFQLKPVTIRTLQGCGTFYDFKILLPDGQFAKVSFHAGGFPVERAPGEPVPEPSFDVDPTPSSSQDE